MNTIKFQNKEYKTREIELPEFGNVLISTTSLNDALLNNGSNYVSDEAKNIDDEIYFFVEENEIEMNEVDLVKLISQQVV
ncbi:MAG: hypothetical protein EAZ07_05640 [Cytophagales bacterium]|nr:MAG: hypothetical protein EAZ07_05640 [Cytophagales bacterium]